MGKPYTDVAALGEQPETRNEDCDDFSIGVTAYKRREAVVVKVHPTAAVLHRRRMILKVGHQGQKFQAIDEAGVAKKV